MPTSGSAAGAAGIDAANNPLTRDTVDRFGREIGFDARYQMSLRQDETGVWTLRHVSMSNDGPNPAADRTVHIDRYSGNILADMRYADYQLFAKFIAVGIALPLGTLGLWSVLANTVICLGVTFMSVSFVVLWWKRRAAGASRRAAPPMPKDMPLWQGGGLVGLAVSMALPLAGLTLWDTLLLSRVPKLKPMLT